jgi:hypothetical protein
MSHFLGNILNEEDNSEETIGNGGLSRPLESFPSKLLDKKAEFAKFRSSSAPPSVVDEEPRGTPVSEEDADAFRADPAYYTYYYNQRLLNPRLPPPVVNWKGVSGAFNQGQKEAEVKKPVAKDSWADVAKQNAQQQQQQQQQQTTVVDRIQKDFPRTPSPVYALNNPSPAPVSLAKAATAPHAQQYLGQQQQAKPYPASQPQRIPRQAQQGRPTPMFFPDTDSGLVQQMQGLSVHDDVQGRYAQELPKAQMPHIMQRSQQPQYIQAPQILVAQQPSDMVYGFFPTANPMYPPMYPAQFVNTGQLSPIMMNYPPQVKDQNQRKMYFAPQPVQPIAPAQQVYAESQN